MEVSKKIKAISTIEIPEAIGLSKVLEFENSASDPFLGHAHGSVIGMILEDGTIKSYFKKDKEDGNSRLFEIAIKEMKLKTKTIHINKNGKLISATQYYVPYVIEGHISSMPTITSGYVEGASNVAYDIICEVLLVADEDLRLYLPVEIKTRGYGSVSLYDYMDSIEDLFDEYFEDKKLGFSVHEDEEYNESTKIVKFYNDLGQIYPVEISSTKELLKMINSVRLVQLKCIID